jgi:trimethylamine---corrinoid protein Co-methyltransferase
MDLLSRLLAEGRPLLADGATGTNLFEIGLVSGEAPELWNETHPEKIAALHTSFVDAGADIILTNSFGGTSRRLMLHHAQGRVHELNKLAAEIARGVVSRSGRTVVVAGSVGPTGDLLAPLGPLTEDEAVDVFVEQMEGLKAGGVDVLWIETMSALEEMRAAAAAAGKVGLPYCLTASFDTAGRTMMGLSPKAMADFAASLSPPPLAFGSNCGVGAADLVLSVLGMSEAGTALPIIAKANAGIPTVRGDRTDYSGTPALMADYAQLALNAGARIVGGCCGTSPEHLAAMRHALDVHAPGARPQLERITALLGQLVSPPAAANAAAERRAERARPTEVPASTEAEAVTPVSDGPVARRRSRTQRSAALVIEPVPARIENPWSPVEVLTAAQVERIVDAAHRVLEEGGLEIRGQAARDLFRKHGALVDDETMMVRIGRDIVEACCKTAPERFVLHARNPGRHMHVGGNVVNFGPVSGAPHITDLDGGRRYGSLADFRDLLKVIHAVGTQHWQGGVLVEPVDIPVPLRQLEMYRAHIELSDLVWAARGVGGENALDAIRMSAIEHGCAVEDLAKRPTLLTVTNVNSPRRVDEEILDNIMTMSAHGQCVVITPFTMMGAMAPVTLAGALTLQTAETLAIITLTQMVRPGSPVVMGAFTSNVDMKSGSPAFGTPEFVHATLAACQLSRRLKVPIRTSAPCASPAVDGQSTYETGFALQAAIMGHGNLITHTAGWLEGGLSASFEKVILDAEMVRTWAAALRKHDFSDDDLGVDAILDIAPGGHFFGSKHTLARYETAFYRPILSDYSNFENWTDAGARDATRRANALWKQLRDQHVPPPLDPEVSDALDAYVARRKEELGFRRDAA